MKTLLLVLVISLVGASGASLPRQSETEKYMEGTWMLEGGDGKKEPRWHLEWTFEKGKFNLSGYPPLNQKGSYRVIKTAGDRLTLELYDQSGNFGTEKSQMTVVFDKQEDTLTIKDKGPYRRVYKKESGY